MFHYLTSNIFVSLFKIFIGNCMISSAIWKKKNARVSFSKTSKYLRTLKNPQVRVYFKIAREIIKLLLINNIHDEIMQNWVTHLRHVQNNLFAHYINNEQSSDRSQTKLKLQKLHCNMYFIFLHCYILFSALYYITSHSSRPIRIQ